MKADEAITKVLEAFESANLSEAVAYNLFPSKDCPSNNWSFTNRLIMYLLGGTDDARTFKQWQQVGRCVMKGKKSFAILAPNTKKIKSTNADTGEEETKTIVKGFRGLPVFRYEDTNGDELDYKKIDLPELPLLDVCEYLGVSVRAIPSNDSFYGYYSDSENTICLATDAEVVLYHELAHKVDYLLRDLKPRQGQQIDREIIAETSATVIAYLLNKKMPDSTRNHYDYLKFYAEKEEKTVMQIVNQYFSEIEAVVSEILRLSDLVKNQ